MRLGATLPTSGRALSHDGSHKVALMSFRRSRAVTPVGILRWMRQAERRRATGAGHRAKESMTIAVIVCAYNEAHYLPACLYSLHGANPPPDEIVVVNNASTDDTGVVARRVPGIRVLDEPTRGLLVARETGRRASEADIVAYVDADCRVPLQWLERIEARFTKRPSIVAVTGPYRYYDWDLAGAHTGSALRPTRRAADAPAGAPDVEAGRDSLRRELRRPARGARRDRRLRSHDRVSR